MTLWTFRTPTVQEGPIGKGRFFSRFKMTKGISIIKSNGVYSQIRELDADMFLSYSEIYYGGTLTTVTDATKAALIAGGVGVDSTNFTVQ